MSDDPLQALLDRSRPDAHELVRTLAAAVESAGIELERRATYGMLVYTLDARWRDWIVAIGVSKDHVNLRFLHGDLLDDPDRRLRAGSSTLMTVDYDHREEVDQELVRAYVREAVAKHPGRSGGHRPSSSAAARAVGAPGPSRSIRGSGVVPNGGSSPGKMMP